MAFKTDQIKLKEDYADNTAAGNPADGTLALIGASGSRELKIRDNNAWVAISGGGGGATILQDLTDVASSPSAQDTVGVVNGDGDLTFAKLTVSNIHVDSVNLSTQWGNDDTTLATTAAIQDWVETWTGAQGYLTSETSHADVLVDGDFGSAGLMTTDGAGNYSITANNFSTVDDLNDLSDVATPATLDATHVGKAVGVVSSGGTASSITFDFSGVSDGTNIGGNIYFTVSGQDYRVSFDAGANPITSDTTFTGGILSVATIDGVQTTTNQVAQDVRVLLDNTFGSSGYTLSGANPQVVMTADAIGTASNIEYNAGLSNINTAGFTMAEVAGTNAAYQYELINTSGAADPNWNHVQNSAWGGDLTIATNTASNLTWVNTQDPTTNELTIRQPSDYGAYAVITVMNASTHEMDISTVDNTFDFVCQQTNPVQSNTITLQSFQKAILVRTSGTDWEVVLASI